ncbi:predicted protein [Phaeodactylum tricornutum CCAP 1055/1]|jgi:hypothetical protein|uniref:Uncharacterized protein n=2 Tax=Phaeodactylum tricornutum TaxID=2850 RepID=B7G4J0_PHATC|nr:predicted protein [Phaeodactylum tricornutum CCAP 1055/1]EEC46620.1 predicted protein [Phaeodactylum tricornutum CCAP 1055/1]|eukprot:XP_002182080.1 predicted protein [Phaeodactylum tricornutum CCAP 1055/1]
MCDRYSAKQEKWERVERHEPTLAFARQRSTRRHRRRIAVDLILIMGLSFQNYASAFLPADFCQVHRRVGLNMAESVDDIGRLQERARVILEKSKAKLANEPIKSELEATGNALPFFASQDRGKMKRNEVIKSKNDEGLITTDGEKMAELSEKEEWEVRGLLDVFESEIKSSDGLKERDVAASIYNLRKTLQNEDYRRIFDKRNRFIGEDS